MSYPIIIGGMTGGTKEAEGINKDIARAAQKLNIGMGVGSQRVAIDDPKLAYTFEVRDVAPDILLIANLGAVQLNYGYGAEECIRAVEMIDADALALHLNPVQEVIQREGNKNFSGLVEKINKVSKELKDRSVPLILKGVGSGISYDLVNQLEVEVIDVGGVGGTSWSLVEGYRHKEAERLGRLFSDFGIPTAECIKELSQGDLKMIASGGIRNGMDGAKALALGADCVEMALLILRAWANNPKHGISEF